MASSPRRAAQIAQIQSYLSHPIFTPAGQRGLSPGQVSIIANKARQLQTEHGVLRQEEQEYRQRQLRQQELNTLRGLGRFIGHWSNVPKAGINDALRDIPTPGGVATPLIILLVFFSVLTAVNGKSRMQWFWDAVTGNAHITGSQIQQPINIEGDCQKQCAAKFNQRTQSTPYYDCVNACEAVKKATGLSASVVYQSSPPSYTSVIQQGTTTV